MSLLTKVFVVLLVVSSVAFTSITVSTVAQTTNWRDLAQKYQENAKIADTSLRHAHASHAAQIATVRDEVRALQRRVGELEADLQSARNETGQSRARLAKAESEKTSAEGMNRGLLAQLEVTEKTRAEYRRQRDDLEGRNIDLQRRNVDLNERVNELTVGMDVLIEQRRQYEQQINLLKADNDRLAGGGSSFDIEHPASRAMPGVRAADPIPTREIRGSVNRIERDLVTISVGSSDGVRKGMVFVIHRGDGQYVGDLKITMVDPNRSAGKLRVSAPNIRPRVGDNVTDVASLRQTRGR